MPEQILELLDKASHVITLLAVVLIVIGFARASIRYAVRLRNKALTRCCQIDPPQLSALD